MADDGVQRVTKRPSKRGAGDDLPWLVATGMVDLRGHGRHQANTVPYAVKKQRVGYKWQLTKTDVGEWLMTFVMGVDGGGSKTHAVIADAAGHVRGEGRSAGCNHQMIGIDLAIRNLKEAVEKALGAAGLAGEELDYVHYALAGADREADFRILRGAISQAFPSIRRWDLTSDAMAGLRTGTPDHIGVVLINGSGTNAVGRSKDGRIVQIGGFGYLYGDCAGGEMMAIETFRHAIRSWEEREIPSILTRKVPEFLGYRSMEQMVDDYLDRQVASVPGELTIVLHEAAEEGDELAIRLLKLTGRELGLAAESVIRRMGDFGIDRAIPIVLVGSVFRKGRSPWLLSELKQTVQAEHPDTTFVLPKLEPVYGAVLLAMDGAGLTNPGGAETAIVDGEGLTVTDVGAGMSAIAGANETAADMPVMSARDDAVADVRDSAAITAGGGRLDQIIDHQTGEESDHE